MGDLEAGRFPRGGAEARNRTVLCESGGGRWSPGAFRKLGGMS